MNKEDFKTEEEVREGVEVPKDLKQIWKVLLDIFEEFIRICGNHGLRYYIDGGSLLGTVRHKGFIPWDDDLDVAMPREDYDKFLEIAAGELTSPFVVQNSLFDEEYTNGYSRIVNCQTTAINRFYADNGFHFHMGIGLDIFPLDPMPDQESDRKKIWKNTILLRSIRHYTFNRNGKGLRFWIHKIAAKIIWFALGGKTLFLMREFPFRRLLKANLDKWASCPGEYGWAKHSLREKAWYDGYVEMPFEYLTVRVPKGYENVLVQIYGKDWRIPKRGVAFHSDLILDPNKSYSDILRDQFGY